MPRRQVPRLETVSGGGGHVNANGLPTAKPPRDFAGIRRHWRDGLPPITLQPDMAHASHSGTEQTPSDRPSEAVRAGVTVAIGLVLAGLALAISTNSLSGSSALLGTVKSRLFSPWLVPAWLDLGWDYRLSYGLAEDADHEIEVAGRGGEAVVSLPADLGGERAARWRRLARTIAVGGLDGDGGVVAAGVARGGFTITGTTDVDVRVIRIQQPDRDAALEPAVEQVYAARVRRVGDDVQLIRDEPRGELAPLLRPPQDRSGP
jgi:hypothetical protein